MVLVWVTEMVLKDLLLVSVVEEVVVGRSMSTRVGLVLVMELKLLS